jgi:chloramphenicol 3-O phosphotransferase
MSRELDGVSCVFDDTGSTIQEETVQPISVQHLKGRFNRYRYNISRGNCPTDIGSAKGSMPIILINGPSSSGKTSVCRAIQDQSMEPYLTIGLDAFINLLPPRYVGEGADAPQGFHFDIRRDGPVQTVEVHTGPYALRVLQTGVRVVRTLADDWSNVLVDEVLYGDDLLKLYTQVLQKHSVYFIGIYCDSEEIERRERSRGDRLAGLARSHTHLVHGPTRHYDLTVDTTTTPPEQCAKIILQFVAANDHPQSFVTLRSLWSQS